MFVSLIPEFYLFFAISFILVWGVTVLPSYTNVIVANLFSWVTSFTLVIILCLIFSNVDIIELGFNGSVVDDSFCNVIKIIITISTILCILLSKDFLNQKKVNTYEYFVVILFAVLGMLLLVSSYDFLTLYIAIEIQSFSFYILACLKKDNAYSTEAGLKYFILGSIASGLLLFGFSLIYGFLGSVQYETLSSVLLGPLDLQNDFFYSTPVALLFINMALFFKLGVFPFHAWLPDVYEGSLTSVAALFGVVPYVAVISVYIRLNFVTFLSVSTELQTIVCFCATVSIVIASFGALIQRKLKRFFAFSAIGHLGYVFLAMSAGSFAGLQAALIYIVIYTVTSVGVWSVIALMFCDIYLIKLHGLYKTNPVFGIAIASLLFSVAGIPPLAGFFAKFFVFSEAINSGLFWFSAISIIASCVSAFYYIRIVKVLFFENSLDWYVFEDFGRIKGLILSITTLFTCFLMCRPEILLTLSQKMVLSLYV